jgi:hypothetical protein
VELDWTDVPSQIVGYNACRSEVEGGPYTVEVSAFEAASNLQLPGDCNQDGAIDLSDAIYKLAFLFSGGSAPVQGVECLGTPCGVSNPACP